MPTPIDDAQLLRRFEDHSLDKSLWTHEAHLRVTYLYARALPPHAALDTIRRGIQSFNAAKGVEQTESGGYHDTLTHVWFRIVLAAARTTAPDADSRAFLAEHTELHDKKLPLRHYSRDLIMSWPARIGFIEPDLAPLPPL